MSNRDTVPIPVTIVFPIGVTVGYADRDTIAQRVASAVGSSVTLTFATAVSDTYAIPNASVQPAELPMLALVLDPEAAQDPEGILTH